MINIELHHACTDVHTMYPDYVFKEPMAYSQQKQEALDALHSTGAIKFLEDTVLPTMGNLFEYNAGSSVSVSICKDFTQEDALGYCNWGKERNHINVIICGSLIETPTELFQVVCHELIHASDMTSGKLDITSFAFEFEGIVYLPQDFEQLKHHQLPWEKVPNRVGKMLGKYWNKVFNGMDVKMTPAMMRPFN